MELKSLCNFPYVIRWFAGSMLMKLTQKFSSSNRKKKKDFVMTNRITILSQLLSMG